MRKTRLLVIPLFLLFTLGWAWFLASRISRKLKTKLPPNCRPC